MPTSRQALVRFYDRSDQLLSIVRTHHPDRDVLLYPRRSYGWPVDIARSEIAWFGSAESCGRASVRAHLAEQPLYPDRALDLTWRPRPRAPRAPAATTVRAAPPAPAAPVRRAPVPAAPRRSSYVAAQDIKARFARGEITVRVMFDELLMFPDVTPRKAAHLLGFDDGPRPSPRQRINRGGTVEEMLALNNLAPDATVHEVSQHWREDFTRDTSYG